MNYRSVGLFGKATLLEDPDAKREALRAFTEQFRRGAGGESAHPERRN